MLKRLFERKASSPRRFRHQIYARIAEREPEAWALCGTLAQLKRMLDNQSTRHDEHVIGVWTVAISQAFQGLVLEAIRGSKSPGRPNGHWTTMLELRCANTYTTTSLHHYITTSLHHYIASSLHHYITTSLHHYITTSLHHYITTPLHHYTTTPLPTQSIAHSPQRIVLHH